MQKERKEDYGGYNGFCQEWLEDMDQDSAGVEYLLGGAATSALKVILETLHRSCTEIQ